jgi:hypothetical protein
MAQNKELCHLADSSDIRNIVPTYCCSKADDMLLYSEGVELPHGGHCRQKKVGE